MVSVFVICCLTCFSDSLMEGLMLKLKYMLSLTPVHYVLQVGNALKAQPRIHDNLTAVMSHFLSIVHTMNQRCSSSLEVFFPNLQSSNLTNLYWKLVAECCVLLWVPLAVFFNSCIACTYVPSVMNYLLIL